MLNWRSVKDDPPKGGQRCLTKMKHGLITGYWDPESKTFTGYYWRDMEWWATHWVPAEEVE